MDLILPIPVKKSEQDPMQEYITQKKHYYTQGDWVINGLCIMYGRESHIEYRDLHAELRFGQHDYMRGFKFCLKAQFERDDKHEIENVRADPASQTITGSIHHCTFVFKVYPFQESRLRRITVDIPQLDVFIGNHIRVCNQLIEK